MTTYNDKTEDGAGRQIHPTLLNTAKDGSGTWYTPVVDANGNIVAVVAAGSAVIGKVGHDKTGVGHGVMVVTTAGVARALVTTSTVAKAVMVQAQTDNANAVAVGGSGVIATVATGDGIILYPGDWTPMFDIDNLTDVFVDALANGEGARFLYIT